MLAQVVAMLLNVALNWLLIYGNLGAPALGVAGTAWASTVTRALTSLPGRTAQRTRRAL